ncbi:DUF3857 domain-containing protein [Thalassotalea ponticola]|uniref:DUF3857 domain-containing transglutaminase family protein n=1 Tax=Thalassotalea ponticola TaxID=1523392 RepID=UPI0025B42DE8|nr:DUF3857 domain-containing protein [Thalassotalea ponticola]MDN3652880.1 DUF3857 domain-containing protein [Thalassotalea ponticola]
MRTPILLLLYTIAVSCSLINISQALADEKPVVKQPAKWVKIADVSVANSVDLYQPVSYLLLDRQVNNTLANKQKYYRYTYRLNNTSSVVDNANIRISFSPDYESLILHQINIIRDGKVLSRLDINKVKIVSDENQQASNILNGQVAALQLIEDARVGDIIDYSYTIEGSNPVFANNFSYIAPLGWSISIADVHYRFVVDANMPLQKKVSGLNVSLDEQRIGDQRILSLSLTNTTKRVLDEYAPTWHNPYPYLQLTSYQSWQDVARWASALFNVDSQHTESLAEFIASIQTMEQSKAIEEAIRFVQDDVRYFGIEIAENSHRPHPPSEVFAKRFGDCKDKTVLLVTLLNAIGVDASAALVSSEMQNSINDYLPTHALFDHVIVKATADDKTYWIDPTIAYQGLGADTLYQPNYGSALIVEPQSTALVVAQPDVEQTSAVHIEEQLTAADYFSPVKWQISTTYKHREAEAMRYQIAAVGLEQMARQYLNYYAKKYPLITPMGDLVIDDDRHSNQITLTEYYLVPQYWQHEQQDAGFTLMADHLVAYVKKPTTIKRRDPYWLHWPLVIDHSVSIQFPEYVRFDSLQDFALNNDYFQFNATLSQDKRTLTYRTHYQNKQNVVAAADTGRFVQDLDKLNNYLGYQRSVLKVTEDPGVNEMQTLLKLLNKRSLAND